MLIVLGELEIPVQFSGVRVEREKGIAVQVIASPARAAI